MMNANLEQAEHSELSPKKGKLSRTVFLVLAGLFALGIVVQVFLAGVALMDDSSYLDLHKGLGYLVILLTIPMLIAALTGRVSSGARNMAIAAVVLGILQYLLIAIGNNASLHIIRALHPVNALALFGLSIGLVRVALDERASDHESPRGRGSVVEPRVGTAQH